MVSSQTVISVCLLSAAAVTLPSSAFWVRGLVTLSALTKQSSSTRMLAAKSGNLCLFPQCQASTEGEMMWSKWLQMVTRTREGQQRLCRSRVGSKKCQKTAGLIGFKDKEASSNTKDKDERVVASIRCCSVTQQFLKLHIEDRPSYSETSALCPLCCWAASSLWWDGFKITSKVSVTHEEKGKKSCKQASDWVSVIQMSTVHTIELVFLWYRE